MKTENSVLMMQARQALAGKWGLAVGTFFVYMLVIFIVRYIPKVGFLVSLLISGAMTLGSVIFSLALSRNQNPKLELIFEGFKRFGVALAAYLLITLFIILWSLLFIIPGIIAGLSYSMTFFIIADNDSIKASEAIELSKKMMMGNKWKFFKLGIRFVGWGLLCILTLGVGLLWLTPYIQVSIAKFYEDIKNPSPVV
jgi:uncharacterized membrane protein